MDILKKNDLSPSDLRDIAEGAPIPDSFRTVIGEYHELAGRYQAATLKQLEDLKSKLSGRYLFSLQLIYELYKMVFDRIDVKKGRFTREELNPGPAEIRDKVLEVASGR